LAVGAVAASSFKIPLDTIVLDAASAAARREDRAVSLDNPHTWKARIEELERQLAAQGDLQWQVDQWREQNSAILGRWQDEKRRADEAESQLCECQRKLTAAEAALRECEQHPHRAVNIARGALGSRPPVDRHYDAEGYCDNPGRGY